VKGEIIKPSLSYEGWVFYWIGSMIANSSLKVAASISLGIHLLFLGIASNLFQDRKLLRIPARYVKVTLLPMVTKEEPKGKITLPVPLNVGDQDRKGPAFDREGLRQAALFPHPSVTNTISSEEPEPILKNKEEEEISNEPVNMGMAPGSNLNSDLNLRNEANTVSSEGTTSDGESLSVSLPSLESGEPDGDGFSFASSGGGLGAGEASGNGSPGKDGSGKGRGILGKFFYAHGGGNGTRPSYVDNPKPIYPQEAKEKGYEGEVVLRVEVLANGRVGQIEIKKSSGYELLDRSALTAVKQWRFIPAKKGDVAIPLWVNIPVKFQLQ
jgi:TonB family protein